MSQTNPPSAQVKVVIPEDWKTRCELIRLSHLNKGEFLPLYSDFTKALLLAENIDFIVYFAAGWDLYEVMRPREFSVELIKQMLAMHKEFPTTTKLCIKAADVERFEKLAEKYKRSKFLAASRGAALSFEPVMKIYSSFSNVSQKVVRGYIDSECYLRVAQVSSAALTNLPSTKEIVRFVIEIIGHEPALYDHGAVTALLTTTIAWNSLELSKRETKLAVQSALIHDVERHCAYLGKPADKSKISLGAIKEVEKLVLESKGFHEANLKVMTHFRDKVQALDSHEYTDISRVVSLACMFSEYLLKRRDKQSLDLPAILEFLKQKIETNEVDKKIFDAFCADITQGKIRKAASAASEEEDSEF